MKVGFLGLGRMGQPMARHVAAAGHDVVGFDVAPAARERASAAGIAVAREPADLAHAHVVCSSLPATAEVEEAYLGTSGVAPLLAPGTVCADLSTISIAASRALAARCGELGIAFVDAPVSGTSIHAEAATLVVMAGGSAAAVEAARPAIEPFASRVERVGDNGAGLELKLITNRLLTTHLVAIAEAIVSMERTELPIELCIDLLRSGAVPRLLDYKAGPLVERDFEPQFTVDLMRKDLRLAAAELPEPDLAVAAREVVEATSALGYGHEDLAALIRVVEGTLGS